MIDVDQRSAEVNISFSVLSCYSSEGLVDPFSFDFLWKDGVSGIAMETSGLEKSGLVNIYPKLIKPESLEFNKLKALGGADWRKLCTAISILDQVIKREWRDLELFNNFDPNFWQGAILNLINEFRNLPPVLRYDEISLKQEMRNPDYEHLWLEVSGLQFGAKSFPHFEMRIGAADTKADSFSHQLKLEFPLLRGGIKPFPSWYQESTDDYGAKFELRYSLESSALDVAALMKLSIADQNLVIALALNMPEFLSALIDKKIHIGRPWVNWMSLVNGAVNITTQTIGR
jgi:hypothetical protein